MSALIAGVVGLAAFVASLLVGWIDPTSTKPEQGDGVVTLAGPAENGLGPSVLFYGAAYPLGILALLAMLGAVVGRRELAARLRLPATGLGLVVAGVIVAIVADLRAAIEENRNVILYTDQVYRFGLDKPTLRPGVILAAVAVVALVSGIWLAATGGSRVESNDSESPVRSASTADAADSGRGAGFVARVVGPGSRERAVALAAVSGAVSVGALVASLLLDWGSLAEPVQDAVDGSAVDGEFLPTVTTGVDELTAGLESTPYGLVFVLGALALVFVVGWLAVRPELAARLRLPIAGLGLGLLGLVAVGVVALRDVLTWHLAVTVPDAEPGLLSIGSGAYLAAIGVVAPIVGTWLAAAALPVGSGSAPAPARAWEPVPAREPAPAPEPASGPEPTAVPAAPRLAADPWPASPTRAPLGTPVGYVDGLTVSVGEAADPHSSADILRN